MADRTAPYRRALLAVLDELSHLRAHARGDRSALVFGTATGRTMSPSNVRTRALAKAVERANASLAARELPTLPDRLTPHSLRRTFVSLLAALNQPTTDVMREAGHRFAERDARDWVSCARTDTQRPAR